MAIGAGSMSANIDGNQNVAIGASALDSNTNGNYNVAIGSQTLRANTTQASNVAIGFNALNNNTESGNIAIGNGAGQNNTTGFILAIGTNALASNTTGINTAIGNSALANNTTGNFNTAIGRDALASNTTGNSNIAIGSNAMPLLTTGTGNNAIGVTSLQNNLTGNGNAANGQATLYSNRTGIQNTAMGSQTMRSNVVGNQNTGIGREALRDTSSTIATLGAITPGSGYTDGTYTGVTLIPDNDSWWVFPEVTIVVAGGVVTTVTPTNTGIGMVVGAILVIDADTAPAGLLAGSGFSIPVATVTTGQHNTGLGYRAGAGNITGNRNLFLGYNAGVNETGSDNLYISNNTTSTPLIKGTFDNTGGLTGLVRINGRFEIAPAYVPTVATDPGTQGQVAFDSNYMYYCTAANTWKRVGIATW
jgi:hypothetical protein